MASSQDEPSLPADLIAEQPTIAPMSLESHDTTGTLPPETSASVPSRTGFPELADYADLQEIARGGMGVVYRARQKSLDRIVALKTVRSGQRAARSEIDLFQAEARAAGKLNHPGIVPVYDVGLCDGFHYFSMPFIDGDSLAALIVDGPMDPDLAADVIKVAAETMQFAHDHQIVHRDLKPANILIDEHGQPRITDFGIAGMEDQAETSFTGGGTPEYMSPEQASGKPTGPATDIYSLGATLYCLLTGRPPFHSHRPVSTIVAVLESDPVPPRRLNPHIPDDLELVCLKCLEKLPESRYSSAQELADELQRFLQGEPVQVHPVGNVGRFLRWSKRQPAEAAMATGLVLSFTAGLALSIYFNFQFRMQRELAIAAQEELLNEVELKHRFESNLHKLVESEQGIFGALEYSLLASVTSAAARVERATEWQEFMAAQKQLEKAGQRLSEEHAARIRESIEAMSNLPWMSDIEVVEECVDDVIYDVRKLWHETTVHSPEVVALIRESYYARTIELLDQFTAQTDRADARVEQLLELLSAELTVIAPKDVHSASMKLQVSIENWIFGTPPSEVLEAVDTLRELLQGSAGASQ